MSKKVIEYCDRCKQETPHRHKLRCTRRSDGKKKGYTSYMMPSRCLTCGYKPEKIVTTKKAKHISLA